MNLRFTNLACSIALVCLTGTSLYAQELERDWAQKLFEVRKHDFGSVGKDSKAEYRFVINNTLSEDVVVARLRSSCGCTSPSIENSTIKAGEKGEIIAKFNTDTFIGMKSATVTVVFQKPRLAEAQLQVSGYIRTDVSVNPRVIDFGAFRDGEAKPVNISVSYAGSSNWTIQDVRSQFSQLQVKLGSRQRTTNGYTYGMTIGLKKNTPEGTFRERMTLITNESNLKTVSIDVIGRVEPDLILSPASINFGSVAKGGTISKRLVLRGASEFAVTSITSGDKRIKFTKPEGSKALHFINVDFNADQVAGAVSNSIRIETDLGGGSVVNCPVAATVRP